MKTKMKEYKYQPSLNPLYCLLFKSDDEGILNLEETSNLTESGLGSYNPYLKTLWRTPREQLKELARSLAGSKLLDMKDKKLLTIFFKEFIKLIKK